MATQATSSRLKRYDDIRTLNEAIAAAADHKARLAQISDTDPAQAAQFISDMLLELRNISFHAKLPQLTYFLEMAFYEAFEQAGTKPRPKAAAGNRKA